MKIIIKSMASIFLITLIGCSSVYISPGQRSTVQDNALNGGTDPLGGSDTTEAGANLPYSLTGGGGL
jgi:hypothetical protein